MAEMGPEELDAVVKRARFDQEGDWWDSASRVVRDLTPDQRDHLATLGLAELVTWSHKIDRDRFEPCMGERAASQRQPDVVPPREDEE